MFTGQNGFGFVPPTSGPMMIAIVPPAKCVRDGCHWAATPGFPCCSRTCARAVATVPPAVVLSRFVQVSVPVQATCNCRFGCHRRANAGHPYCGRDCAQGNCVHALNRLGQNIGRAICACHSCHGGCDQAAFYSCGHQHATCDACHHNRHDPH